MALIERCRADLNKVKNEVAKVVVGQGPLIDGLLRALLANGHVLIEGVPGIAKTLIVRALAASTSCKFKRIQFTADLLPTDILGITSYEEEKGFFVIKGPIFGNFILGDEINRAPPKVQSALLEAMQEKQVTIGRETFPLEKPFSVIATQNPIETLGTYPLPEAQIDRFIFKLMANYPSKDEEKEIIVRNISMHRFEHFKIMPAITPKRIIEMQELTKKIGDKDRIKDYIVEIINATRNPTKYNIGLGKYIQWGSSPRAGISLFIGAKADAVLNGQMFIKPQNVKNVALSALSHRIILNYRGEAEGIVTEDVIKEIISKVGIP
ncbi:MAG: MoxR family ATPase [Candidatus Woesearchaeota archaeon]|nr:MoxR family ATPase [Candidatus Woesearchaeota archaeon]